MGLNCQCPPAASLAGFEIPQCLDSFGQVNKVIFQRVLDGDGDKNEITAPTTLASWTPAFAAADGTKMVISPFVYNPTTTAGAKKTYGGGNATPGGVVDIIGAEPTTFEAELTNMPQSSVIKVLKQMMCENVGVYLINERGQIGGIKTVTSGSPGAVKLAPIPVQSLFIGDKAFGGLDEPDKNALEWSFKPNWSDDFGTVTPEFDALTVLTNTI